MSASDWPYPKEPPMFDKPGTFDAWIVATRGHSPENVSGFAWLIKSIDPDQGNRDRARTSEGSDSSEQSGYVAGVYRAAEAVPPNSRIKIFCKAENIVGALTENWLGKWEAQDFKGRKQGPIWKRYIEATRPRHIDVELVRWLEGEYQEIYDHLIEWARLERDKRISELGFDVVEDD